jgi:RNA polymerase sigma-70 factor (ECF subfamily)
MIQNLEQTPTSTDEQTATVFTDEQLMKMIQARHAEALNLLHGRYVALVKSWSLQVLHNMSDAEDLVQEVFLEIWERATYYNPAKGKPIAWIAVLTRHRSIDRLRRRSTYDRVGERFAEEVKSSANDWTHVHEELAHEERSQQLHQALAGLPEKQRTMIQLAYHRQMTHSEIATRTGIPLGTIKARLKLGLQKMAGVLFKYRDLV